MKDNGKILQITVGVTLFCVLIAKLCKVKTIILHSHNAIISERKRLLKEWINLPMWLIAVMI